MSNNTIFVSSDDHKSFKTSLILVGVLMIILLVVIIVLVVFVIAPETATRTETSFVSPSAPTTPTVNLPPGSVCTGVSECVPDYYCSGSGICTSGSARPMNAVCSQSSQCQIGSYCSGAFTCQPGVGWTTGGPCNTANDCQEGYDCVSGTCSVSVLPVVPACTLVPVYNVLLSSPTTSLLHVNSVTTVPTNALFYQSSNPIWYGCSTAGANRIPIYLWKKASINDYILSVSAVQPFTNGTSGYVIENSGNPVIYTFDTQFADTVPIYSLFGFSFSDATNYAATQANSTSFTQEYQQQKTIYTQIVTDTSAGFLGYGIIA